MSKVPIAPILLSAGGAHAADQLALAALPLVAVVALGLGPGQVAALVAAQGAAWAVATLPAGLMIDRRSRRGVVLAAQALAVVALAGALVATLRGWSLPLAGFAFLAACGAVAAALALQAAVPAIATREALPTVNARIELVRALSALGAPLLAGFMAERGQAAAAFALAALAAMLSMAGAARLGPAGGRPAGGPAQGSVWRRLRAGGAFVLGEPLLRAIALCALFWNFAFFALLATFVPFAVEQAGFLASEVGVMLAAAGFGNLAAAAVAPRLMRRLAPSVLLVGGPTMSVVGAATLIWLPAANGPWPGFVAFGLLGFGPMLWLVCQTSVRQLVTPAHLLGRVSATVQMAIYGIRPLGALAGGAVAALASPGHALFLVIGCFAGSALVALFSPLARLATLPAAAASVA